MRAIITFFILFACLPVMAAQSVESTVDKRVELLSVIFRLAGNPEYNMKFAKNYISDINLYFEKYKGHPVIGFAKELNKEKGIGFSKVMFLAVDLEYKNNRFSLIKQSENSLVNMWDMEDALKFVDLANDFYKTSKFEVFFNNHKSMYTEATKRFDEAVADFDQQWYFDYYGDHDAEYKMVIGIANGGANYGPHVKPVGHKKLIYAIMGSWSFNAQGKALFPKEEYLPYLVHEFNHSFINHILEEDGNEAALQTAGEILLNDQREAMRLEAYEDWQGVINESLVRASVVRYMIDHKDKDEAVQEEISKQVKKGFLWTKELVALLGEYESSRDKYPTFKSFYPRIITFFKTTADHIKQ